MQKPDHEMYDSFNGTLPSADMQEALSKPEPPAKKTKAPANTPKQPAPVSGKATTGRCYESHPVLSLGGGTFVGGSCLSPVVIDADVYIGFERNMLVLPFDPTRPDPMYISYPITDMAAPANHLTFKALVLKVAELLHAGKKVHAGCIGGHGRTGTFLSALVAHVNKNPDAITWVRENYCHKAVESQSQMDFLQKHFGIIPKEPVKTYSAGPSLFGTTSSGYVKSGSYSSPKKSFGGQSAFKDDGTTQWTFIPSKRDVVAAGLV